MPIIGEMSSGLHFTFLVDLLPGMLYLQGMSRRLRLLIPDDIYHEMTRGLERRDIFYDDQDRRYWLTLLDSVANRRDWRILARVLMDNHFHLFLCILHGALSSGMHDLNAPYVSNQSNTRSKM